MSQLPVIMNYKSPLLNILSDHNKLHTISYYNDCNLQYISVTFICFLQYLIESFIFSLLLLDFVKFNLPSTIQLASCENRADWEYPGQFQSLPDWLVHCCLREIYTPPPTTQRWNLCTFIFSIIEWSLSLWLRKPFLEPNGSTKKKVVLAFYTETWFLSCVCEGSRRTLLSMTTSSMLSNT